MNLTTPAPQNIRPTEVPNVTQNLTEGIVHQSTTKLELNLDFQQELEENDQSRLSC